MASFTYRFTSTTDDLLDAESVVRSLQSPRPPFRFALVVLGVLWLAAGAALLQSRKGATALLPLCLGALVIYQHVVMPQLNRRRIARENPAPLEVTVELREDGVDIKAVGARQLLFRWSELQRFVSRRRGVLLRFANGTVSWIPRRVFATATSQDELVAYLKSRLETHQGTRARSGSQ